MAVVNPQTTAGPEIAPAVGAVPTVTEAKKVKPAQPAGDAGVTL